MIETSNYAPALALYPLAPPLEIFVLPHQGNSTQNIGVRTGAGEFILRVYRSGSAIDTLRYEHRLLHWLVNSHLSFGVPTPMPTVRGDTLIQTAQGWMALFPRLPGTRLDRNDLTQIEAFGSALGELHMTLCFYPSAGRPGVIPIGSSEAITAWFSVPVHFCTDSCGSGTAPVENQLRAWWQEECTQLQEWVEREYQLLPRQVIHNDFIPANVLVSAGQITAILDFEFAAPDVRVFDLAIGLRNMLRVWEEVAMWEIVHRFCRGYRRWNQLSMLEIAAVPWLIRLRNLWRGVERMGPFQGSEERQRDLQHIEQVQEFAQWIIVHQQRLVDTMQSVFQ